jgi:hypothetical protein
LLLSVDDVWWLLGFMVPLWWVAIYPMVGVVWSLPGYCIFVLFAFIK